MHLSTVRNSVKVFDSVKCFSYQQKCFLPSGKFTKKGVPLIFALAVELAVNTRQLISLKPARNRTSHDHYNERRGYLFRSNADLNLFAVKFGYDLLIPNAYCSLQ